LIKDDGHSGSIYGGNKVRKLEPILADALHHGFRSCVTVGAAGSNHALATALYCRQIGLPCHVIHFDQPPTDHVRRNLAAISEVAELHHVGGVQNIARAVAMWRIRDRFRSAEIRSYFVPGGGSSPLGVLGYVNAALELAEQLRDMRSEAPLRLYVAAGTVGTLAGIILGLGLARLTSIDVVGVRVVDRFVTNPPAVRRLIAGARKILKVQGVRLPSNLPHWSIEDSQFGAGYGVPTQAGLRAMSVAKDRFGLTLEPTYTAKAFAAVLADSSPGPILYWHTLNAVPLPDVPAGSMPADLPPPYAHYFE
jgi:D-cysteine desulfhydrase